MGKYPQNLNKYESPSVINPERFLQYLFSKKGKPNLPPPETAILCYQTPFYRSLTKKHPTQQNDSVFRDLHYLSETQGRVAFIGGFGIGSPATAVVMEELIAFGIKKFISIGSAGALQRSLNIGDLVICDKAIRDEGSSHHYLPSEKFALPDSDLTNLLAETLTEFLGKTLRSEVKSFSRGTSWTIDCPYRETEAEVLQYQNEGVLCVEMEAAALFSVAKFRGVQIASAFTISDSLADLQWQPHLIHPLVNDQLELLFAVAVKTAMG